MHLILINWSSVSHTLDWRRFRRNLVAFVWSMKFVSFAVSDDHWSALHTGMAAAAPTFWFCLIPLGGTRECKLQPLQTWSIFLLSRFDGDSPMSGKIDSTVSEWDHFPFLQSTEFCLFLTFALTRVLSTDSAWSSCRLWVCFSDKPESRAGYTLFNLSWRTIPDACIIGTVQFNHARRVWKLCAYVVCEMKVLPSWTIVAPVAAPCCCSLILSDAGGRPMGWLKL